MGLGGQIERDFPAERQFLVLYVKENFSPIIQTYEVHTLRPKIY